jgi:hypothetical protein
MKALSSAVKAVRVSFSSSRSGDAAAVELILQSAIAVVVHNGHDEASQRRSLTRQFSTQAVSSAMRLRPLM